MSAYQETITSPKSEKWIKVMKSEMYFTYTNQIWTLIEPLKGSILYGSSGSSQR